MRTQAKAQPLQGILPYLCLIAICLMPLDILASTITASVSTIQLKEGTTSATVNLIVKAEDMTDAQLLAGPELTMISTSDGGPTLSRDGNPEKIAEFAKGAFFRIPARVQALPLNATTNIPVLLMFDKNASTVLSFSFVNTAPAVEAEVSPGSDTIQLEHERETQFTVNLKGRPLRGLAVCQSTLADGNTGERLGEQHLQLYLDKTAAEANPQKDTQYLTLSAASTKVHLYVLPTFQSKGIFNGNVALCSASKASVATLKLTVASTRNLTKIIGILLIVAGTLVYILVAIILKQQSRRLTALLPAARLTEALRDLQASVKKVQQKVGVEFPVLLGGNSTNHSFEQLISELTPKKLKDDGYLPPLLTNPFQPADLGGNYQQFLQGMSMQELNLAVIVREGLERVISLWSKLNEASARNALSQLDQLALQADSTDPMRPKVDQIVTNIPAKTQAFAISFASIDFAGMSPSVHEIMVQQEQLSILGWLIWASFSVLLGTAVLVLSNHGFGTWQDMFKCLLWGLGVQAAGQGLQGLSPSAAFSTFSLQIGR